jgi:superoxide dismutase, Fe-Mn family
MYEIKNFDHLLGTQGFSDQLLQNHFTLYQGYVKNTNTTLEKLASLRAEDKVGTPEYAELKRRFGWEFNGMRLHELYFGNMVKDGSPLSPDSTLAARIAQDFDSWEQWERDFKATGAIRGIGWAVLVHDATSDTLMNVWVNEHDVGHLAGCTPILIMDVFEHAFMLDYGLKRANYIEAFFQSIDWNAVGHRQKQ